MIFTLYREELQATMRGHFAWLATGEEHAVADVFHRLHGASRGCRLAGFEVADEFRSGQFSDGRIADRTT